jgi:ferritin-like metal-binding protein YciE
MAMAINSAEDLFLNVLSRLHQAEQRQARAADEMSQIAQTKEAKEALTVRAYLGKQEAANIEECFQLLGEQPRQITPSRIEEVAAEEFRLEMNAIQSPALKTVYALHAVREIQDLHIGEYKTLVVMARMAEQWGVAGLLERNLANKLVFEERTDEIVRAIAKTAFTRWLKAKAAA